GRSEHPAFQGHTSLCGRSRPLRVPGRAHDARWRPPAPMGRRREAREPYRFHWPQPGGRQDPRRLRGVSGLGDTSSLAARTRPVAPGSAVTAVHFLKQTAAFVLAEEALLLVSPEGEERRVGVHAGAILTSASDGRRIVTGGDDGAIVATGADGAADI